jgi:hypothetical protein
LKNYKFLNATALINSNYSNLIDLFKSTDGGITWARTEFSFYAQEIHEIIKGVVKDRSNPNIIYILTNNKVYRTLDGFDTLEGIVEVFSDPNEDFKVISADPFQDGKFYVGGRNLISFNDYGNSHVIHTSTLPSPASTNPNDFKILSIDPLPDNIYVRYYSTQFQPNGNELNIGYLSFAPYNNLSDWTVQISNNALLKENAVFKKSHIHNNASANDNFIFLGKGQGSFYRSVNGNNFTATTLYSGFMPNGTYTHADIRCIDYNDLTGEITLGTDGGILHSADYGITWFNKNGTGFHAQQFHGIAISELDASVIVGGLQDSEHFAKTGQEWIHIQGGYDGYDVVINPLDPTKGYALGNSNIFKLHNIGNTSISTIGYIPLPAGSNSGWQYFNKQIAIDDNGDFYTAWNDIYKYNSASGWLPPLSNFSGPPFNKFPTKIETFELNNSNPSIIYASCSGPFWDYVPRLVTDVDLPNNPYIPIPCNSCEISLLTYRYDPQNGWRDISAGLEHARWNPITSIISDPNNSDHVFVSFGGYGTNTRMMYSDNGGNDWYNISSGLPAFPINTLQFQKGTECTVYAGTDVGTFVFKKSQTQTGLQYGTWECYNKNAPVGIVKDLEINYCSGKLVASYYGRGVWVTDLLPFEDLIINSNVTYSIPQIINKNIVIEAGYTLIVNSRLDMSENTKIVVKRGATLLVDGINAIISNGCGSRWRGIEVWGNSNINQSTSNEAQFGKVIVNNNGTIENAITAITTMKIDANGNWDYDYSGGIIQCYKATFKNCSRSVQFLGYVNRNNIGQEIDTRSYFRQTNFILDDNYKLDWGNPYYQVTADNSSGVRFMQCKFANYNTSITDISKLGGGIYAINSKISVVADQYSYNSGTSTPIGRSTFSNLNFGIFAQYPSGSLRNLKVDATDFSNVLLGTTNLLGNKPSINRCTFSTSGNFFPGSEYIKWGIGLSGVSSFRVEENIFNGSFPTTHNEIGIGIVSSGSASNTIYKNTFNNLSYGLLVYGDNRGALDPTGLQFVCNEYSNNLQDNYVGNCLINNDITCDALGIAFVQGVAQTATITAKSPRNKFNSVNPLPESNLKNETLSPIVYINSVNPTPPNDITYYTPVYVTTASVATSIEGCPSNFIIYHTASGGKDKIRRDLLDQGIIQSASNLQNIKNLLAATVDDGNTTTVINTIISAQSTEVQSLVTSLLDKSPNLSDDVIYQVAFDDQKFTPITQMIVLAANPHAGRNKDLMRRLAEKDYPMPPEMIAYIENFATFGTNKDKVETMLSNLKQADENLNRIIYEYFENDTTGINPDSLFTYAKKSGSPQAMYGIVSAMINEGKISEAETFYTSILLNYRMTRHEQEEYIDYGYFMERLILIKLNNWELHQIPLNLLSEINTLAENGRVNFASIAACAIITYLEDKRLNETYIHLPSTNTSARFASSLKPPILTLNELIAKFGEPQILPTPKEKSSCVAFPNPAKDLISFEYEFHSYNKDGKIIISNELGVIVYSGILPYEKNKLDISLVEFNNGSYFYSIYFDNNPVKKDSFIVIK